MRIEVERPVRAIVDHVIIGCSPRETVGWIDHALGVTMEQWVVFEPRTHGGTQVRTWAEFTGSRSQVAGVAIKPFLEKFVRTWYGKYRDACDRAAAQNAAT
jgi:hypothetical protein